MTLVETSFPRGGTIRKLEEPQPVVFGAQQRKSESRKKQKKHDEKSENRKQSDIEARTAELLSYKTIQEGMLLMGVVKLVDPVLMKISLPGGLVGKVLASNISDSYTKVLNKFVEAKDPVESFQPLSAMYQVGQIVYVKVMQIKGSENGKLQVHLSMKPSDVHSNMHHEHIRKGMLFNGAIQEVLDHGYVIETGVNNLRGFLPKDKASEPHCVGELVFIKVDKLTQSSSASTVTCKEVDKEKSKIKDITDPNLDYIVPSSQLNFTVTKILKNGLQGTIMNGSFKAYVNEHQFHEPLARPTDYEENTTVTARLLYIMPLTKLVYLSLKLNVMQEDEVIYHKGDIVETATVSHIGTGGIILNLDGKSKGLISFKSLKVHLTGNYDEDVLLAKYAKSSKLTVRVVTFDPMDSTYICTDDRKAIAEKFYTLTDLKPGDFVEVSIVEKDKLGGYQVKIGNVKGLIEKIFLASSNIKKVENTKLRCRVLALDPVRNLAYLTNRAEYMAKDSKVLTDVAQAKENRKFLGTVVKNDEDIAVVKFFNNITGILIKSMASDTSTFFNGLTMNFRIVKNNEGKIVVGLLESAYQVGDIVPAKVSSVLQNGLDVTIKDENNTKALVPLRMISDYPELAMPSMKSFQPGDEIKISCITQSIFSIRDILYFTENPPMTLKMVEPGAVIRGLIRNVENDIVEMFLPIKGYDQLTKVHMNMFLEKAVNNVNVAVYPDQVVYVRVLSKEKVTAHLTVSAKLTDVWDCSLKTTSEVFATYISELKRIKVGLKSQGLPLGAIDLGQVVQATVVSFDEHGQDYHVELPENIPGVIKKHFVRKPLEVGQTLKCVVLWIDYLNAMVFVSHQPMEYDRISVGTSLPSKLVNQAGLNGRILLKTTDAIVCSLKKGPNPLVLIPTKLHYNDFESSIATGMKEGEFCRLVIISENHPIAVFEHIWKTWKSSNRKRKIVQNHEDSMLKKIARPTKPLILIKQERDDDTVIKDEDSDTSDDEPVLKQPALPGPSGFWSNDLDTISRENKEQEESSDEEMDTETEIKRKRKQTAAEKFKLAKEEEARLREIEEKFADPNMKPETADHFDRLILAEPNNSKIWIQYMVFYLSSTDIEKARVIARRALKTINFREEDELLNIWVALLNLELRYGSKEAFNDTLKECLMYNDSYKVYTRVMQIYVDVKKTQELTETINIVTKKFKDKPEIWKISANAYFDIDLPEKAKQLLHKALNALPERDHINTIVAFANLNHKYGDKETAHTLYEQVLTSYPKRVDVWSQYVDLLVKDGEIEDARRTLERAVIHKIPIKKMRTLFKKYIDFEEKHGNEEHVLKVKAMAEEYVRKEINS